MVQAGAQVVRHEDTTTSAIGIIRQLVNKRKLTVQIQHELEEHKGKLLATAAGHQLNEDMIEQYQLLLSRMAGLENQLKSAQANEPKVGHQARKMSREWDDLKTRVNKLESDRQELTNMQVSILLPPSKSYTE